MAIEVEFLPLLADFTITTHLLIIEKLTEYGRQV